MARKFLVTIKTAGELKKGDRFIHSLFAVQSREGGTSIHNYTVVSDNLRVRDSAYVRFKIHADAGGSIEEFRTLRDTEVIVFEKEVR